jgi:hypothetical protein
MRRTSYMKRASSRFLDGTTRCKTPADAVESGQRTLAQWALLLGEERDRELEYLQERLLVKRARAKPRSMRTFMS